MYPKRERIEKNMCGIIARISKDKNPSKTLDGLRFLEYRGYDSYGILMDDLKKKVFKKNAGEITDRMLKQLKTKPSHIEIGHTRWATHGKANRVNAHPHFDADNQFFVVMNGIIENDSEIKEEFKKSFTCISESDAELIPHLYAYYFQENSDGENDILTATKKVVKKLKGEFSFVVKYKDVVLVYKNINPLIIGRDAKGEEILVCSDINYVQNHSEKYLVLDDEDIVLVSLREGTVNFETYFHSKTKNGRWRTSVKSAISTENTFDSYMEKEIYDQRYIKKILTDHNIENIEKLKELIAEYSGRVFITAAGTSYHAASFMHYTLIEDGINSYIVLASELHNYIGAIDNALIIVLSQSGETADLIYPLKKLKKNNTIFTITNTPNSTLDRFSTHNVYLSCGQEISVAATKTFSFQIFVAQLLRKSVNVEGEKSKILDYETIFDSFIADTLPVIRKVCTVIKKKHSVFFIGRHKHHPLALEGALKLKEITYIHAEGFAGGELKHGTLALIEKGTPVFVLGDDRDIVPNAIEIKTRGGIIIGVSPYESSIFSHQIQLPERYVHLFMIIAMQFIALRTAVVLKRNPDRPRNLAKSITVK